jgi:hypothetical protein
LKKSAAQHVATFADMQLSAQVPTMVPSTLQLHMPSAHELAKTVEQLDLHEHPSAHEKPLHVGFAA